MRITRRSAMGLMAGGVLAGIAPQIWLPKARGQATTLPDIAPGPFQGTRQSLQAYTVPDWFRDAKFGIWAHWGPQSAPEYGDWYARKMYIQGDPTYNFHVEKYGHPSKFGFKDIIPTWKADKFDPDYLVSLYKKAGAKYFCSMGVHHDNFDLWNSRHQKWNAVNMGPKKDIVGLFKEAAQKNDLKFAISDHLWISYKWFGVSHGADATGSMAGVSYDGVDPQYADLYHEDAAKQFANVARLPWNEDGIPDSWKAHWFDRIKDLVDQYQPDLLYCDGPIPFETYGLSILAHLYNSNAARNGGKVQAIYTSKRREDSQVGTCLLDVERGLVDRIWPNPWQTDTCIGNWHYDQRIVNHYKTPKTIVDMLCDIVSRNGNLMLNFPLPNSGMLDDNELKILEGITTWMNVNSEGIHGTRPYKIFGDGPSLAAAPTTQRFNENNRRALTAQDIRFTTKGGRLYAFVMGWPEKEAVITALGTAARQGVGKIESVQLLGVGYLKFTQDQSALKIQLPEKAPCDHAVTFKINWA